MEIDQVLIQASIRLSFEDLDFKEQRKWKYEKCFAFYGSCLTYTFDNIRNILAPRLVVSLKI